jgi:galactokinase
MSLDVLAERSAELFAKCFGHPPRWLVAAPGRVNLIGEHTDYNDGFVLPLAIEHHMVIAADRAAAKQATVHSVTTGETATFPVRSPIERGEPGWSNYLRGVVTGFQNRGVKVGGFDAVIDSSLPFGGGLASSAALEVATATFLEAFTRKTLEPMEKILLCQRAEHDFAGVPCGIMDQLTSVLAKKDHALLLDCRSLTFTPVPITDPALTVLIINTKIRHKLAESEYAQRRAECEAAAKAMKVPSLRDANLKQLKAVQKKVEPAVFRRARHVITENERTLEAAGALQKGDWQRVGQLMYASHASLRDDYEVSCPELDTVVEAASAMPESEGMIGCRMTGGGFGGCAVSLVRTDAVKHITRKIADFFEQKTGSHAEIFSSRPAAGARVIKGGAPPVPERFTRTS